MTLSFFLCASIFFAKVGHLPPHFVRHLIAVPILATHLQVMSRLARIFHDDSLRSGLLKAADPEAALALIVQREAALSN